MTAQTLVANASDADAKRLYRVAATAAGVLVIGYILTFPIYAFVGPPPAGGEAWIAYAAGKTAMWWGIVGLSVATDVLYVPIAMALYVALRQVHRNTMLLATACVLLFVVLDLAVTWSNYAGLIVLSGRHAAATTDAQRAAYVAAAEYGSAVLTSPVEGVYSIGILSLGIFITGAVMLGGVFNKLTAYLGLLTGALAILSVVGPWVASALGAAIILASVLTTVWVGLVGYRLYRLSAFG